MTEGAVTEPEGSKKQLYRRMLKEIVEDAPDVNVEFGHTLFPPQVVVEATCACNQQCVFCGRTYLERPKGHMRRDLFNRIVDEIATENPMTEILPAYMGESMLLGDELFDRLATARRLGCRKISLNTNGTLVEDHIPRLLEGSIDRLIVSGDAHTSETHRKIRPGKKTRGLEGVTRGVQTLLDEMRRKGLTKPFVEMAFTIFDENEPEADAFIDYWLKQGTIVKIRPKVFHGGTVPGGTFRVTVGAERVPCLWLRDTFVVTWNGNVVLCPCDVDAKVVAGNVEAMSIRDIWNGALRWIRELHLRRRFRELPEICRKCTDWQSRRSFTYFPDEALRAEYLSFIRLGRMFVHGSSAAPGPDVPIE